jgi:hypothetical protein
MAEVLYDDQCLYCWGDPRLDEKFVQANVLVLLDGIKLETDKDSLFWPQAAVKSASYEPTFPVDIEAAAAGSQEAAEDIAIGLAMDHIPEPGVSLVVSDPEGVYPDGFDIRLVFCKEYNARVFAKRVTDTFGLASSGK